MGPPPHFLDRLLRTDRQLRVEDVQIPADSNLVGRTLKDVKIRETGALVIAINQPDGNTAYNPGGEQVLDSGCSLVVIAHHEDLVRLREGIADDRLLAI